MFYMLIMFLYNMHEHPTNLRERGIPTFNDAKIEK